MKKRLAQFLVCPDDRQPLELVEWETFERSPNDEDHARLRACAVDPAEVTREVTTGLLLNPRTKTAYPIFGGVPRLLRFRTGVGDRFAATWGPRLSRELPGFSLPSAPAMPGEEEVLRTFSNEWLSYDWDGQTYWNQSAEEWFRSMDFMLELEEPAQLAGKRVLEIGIGIGGVAEHVCRKQRCEQVGMDLGYATDAAYRHFGADPLLHIVQASAFHPPFADDSFDFVYSFGVIHHTFSTAQAFQAIARLPRASGGRLFIWVYGPGNENRTALRRGLMALETVARPVVTRLPEQLQTVALLPAVPAYMATQWVRSKLKPGQVPYGPREALHAARDRLTPPYAHRHEEAEVRAWFESAGYRRLRFGSDLSVPSWLPIGFHKNTSVLGVLEA